MSAAPEQSPPAPQRDSERNSTTSMARLPSQAFQPLKKHNLRQNVARMNKL